MATAITAAKATPTGITSLVDLSSSVDGSNATNSKSGKYHVLQRLVSAHPFRRGSHWNSITDRPLRRRNIGGVSMMTLMTSGCVWLSTVDQMGARRFTLYQCRQMLTHRLGGSGRKYRHTCWAAFPGNPSTLTMRTSAQYSSLSVGCISR
jgi:hypothetical protein